MTELLVKIVSLSFMHLVRNEQDVASIHMQLGLNTTHWLRDRNTQNWDWGSFHYRVLQINTHIVIRAQNLVAVLIVLVLPLVSRDEVHLVLREPLLQVYVRFLNGLDTCQDASQMSL